MNDKVKTKSIVKKGDLPEMDVNNPTIGDYPEKDRMWKVPSVSIYMLTETLKELGFTGYTELGLVAHRNEALPRTLYGLIGVMASRIRRLEILVEHQHEQLNPKIIIPGE